MWSLFFVAWGSERSNDAGAGGKAGNDVNAVLVSSTHLSPINKRAYPTAVG
ncbi:MAG: hypothetical protein IKA81_07700 [Alistipes sp.]|nr:hypothetical protein [Alistipes sp.]